MLVRPLLVTENLPDVARLPILSIPVVSGHEHMSSVAVLRLTVFVMQACPCDNHADRPGCPSPQGPAPCQLVCPCPEDAAVRSPDTTAGPQLGPPHPPRCFLASVRLRSCGLCPFLPSCTGPGCDMSQLTYRPMAVGQSPVCAVITKAAVPPVLVCVPVEPLPSGLHIPGLERTLPSLQEGLSPLPSIPREAPHPHERCVLASFHCGHCAGTK